MQETLIQAATQEPVSLAMAKQYLRVTHSLEDEIIGTMISSARKLCEDVCRISISPQRWKVTYRLPRLDGDAFGLTNRIVDPERIKDRCSLPRIPAVSVNGVSVLGRNGRSFNLPTYSFDPDTSSLAWTSRNGIIFRWGYCDDLIAQDGGANYVNSYGVIWMEEFRYLQFLAVDFWAGYPLWTTLNPGQTITPFQAPVVAPTDLVQAVLLVLSSLYEERGDSESTIPKKALLALRPYYNSTRSAG